MNMTKAYRAELRDLKQAERKIQRDYKSVIAGLDKHRRALEISYNRAIHGRGRALNKIKRRQAILEGRLS
jgi:hypothetical protein